LLPIGAGLWLTIYLLLKFAIPVPLPSSMIFMYMSLVTVCILLYVSVFEDDIQSFFGPIGDFVRKGGVPCWVAFLAIAGYFSNNVYHRVMPSLEPPLEQRVVHPAPPTEFVGLYNPFREDEEHFKENVRAGGEVFFKNCFFCHGDKLDGNGMFADGFNLRPANFIDPTTIPMLQEAFVFWRISKGGIGLPEESTPWSSAMPRWEAMLSEEERWKVILFLYDYTGYQPRTWE
jgi:hypothetical protein